MQKRVKRDIYGQVKFDRIDGFEKWPGELMFPEDFNDHLQHELQLIRLPATLGGRDVW